MKQEMRAFMKEYYEEVYEDLLKREEIQECVDRAERLLSLTDAEREAMLLDALFEPYSDDGHDDFGHEYGNDDYDLFPDPEPDAWEDYEEKYNP